MPRNVHFTLSKMTIANQTQLTGDGSSVVPSKENDVIRFHAYVARENSAVDFIASMSLACLRQRSWVHLVSHQQAHLGGRVSDDPNNEQDPNECLHDLIRHPILRAVAFLDLATKIVFIRTGMT